MEKTEQMKYFLFWNSLWFFLICLACHLIYQNVMMGDVVQSLECDNCNLKALGSIPWWGRVKHSNLSVPPSQLLCRLVCVWPPLRVYSTHPNVCTCYRSYVYMICRQRVDLKAGGVETQQHCTHRGEGGEKLGSAMPCYLILRYFDYLMPGQPWTFFFLNRGGFLSGRFRMENCLFWTIKCTN